MTTPDIDLDRERERFERWVRQAPGDAEQDAVPGRYWEPDVQFAWVAWREALVARARRCEELERRIKQVATEIENSAGVNSAPFADMVRKILEDEA